MSARAGTRGALLNAVRILTELIRDPAMLGLELLLPIFFLGLTAIGYSKDPRPYAWGAEVEPAALASRPGLEEALAGARHADGRPAFELAPAPSPNSSAAPRRPVIALRQGADGRLVLEGDALSSEYIAASNKVEEILDGLAPSRAGAARLVSAPPRSASASSDFEAFAPGMMIFAVLLLIPQTAFIIGRDSRRGAIGRLSGTGMGASSYLGSVALSQAAFAVAQGIIMVALAAFLGYSFGPKPVAAASLFLGILILLSLSSVAQGLAVGAFAKSDSSAINVGSVVAMLQVFLSGSFFAMPSPSLAIAGHPGLDYYAAIGAYDIFPATHAIEALRMTASGDAAAALPPLAAMGALTLAFFSAAAFLFGRRLMRAS